MRHARRSYLPGLIVLLFLFGFVTPPGPAAAQEFDCPEGLVYDEASEICLPLEDVPAEEEPVDVEDAIDDGETTDEATDDGSDGALDEDVTDDGEMTDDADDGATDDDLDDPATDAPAIVADEAAPIKNLTLLTFACPINWNPATRPIEDSREMCTEPIVPAMNYTVLFEGQELTTAGLRTDVDLAVDLGLNGVPLPPGMYTIRENLQEGLEDPFAFCAIYAADGTSRLTVEETVPGGSLDILLAAGEEVNCEWYSVATVPEVTGDPNALPIGGLKLDAYSCPYGTSRFSSLEPLIATCIEKGVAVVDYTASLAGAVVSTQAGATDTPGVDFQKGLDTRLLSGTWTLAANLPPEYAQSYMFCSITTAAGTTTVLEPETLFDFIELELQPDEIGHCQWFNVEAEPRTGPSLGISLLLHTCPEGFDPDAGDYQTCTLPLQEPITFDFIRDGQVVETGTASAPDTQLAATTNGGRPEAGEWTIRPNVPSDRIEPGWGCFGVDKTGAKVLGINYFTPTDGGSGISAKFGPNLMLQCDVWLYAGDLGETVQVIAHTCPDGFDPTNPAAGDRNATCPKARFIGVTFAVDDVPEEPVETRSNGMAFTPTRPGQWRMTLAPEDGRGVSFVTCDHTRAALNQVQTIEPTINADNLSITLDLEEGDTLRCDFFLGPMTAAAEEPAAGGEDAGNGEEAMTGEEGAGTGETETGAGAPGMDPAPDAGEAGGATDPADTGPGGGTFGGGGAPGGETGTGGGQAVQVVDGATGEPAVGETSSLSIQHYACEAPVADATSDELVESCTASLEPGAWVMNGEPLDVADGYAVWDGLAPESVSVSNLAAEDKDDMASAVYCSIAPSDGLPLVGIEVPVKDGAIEVVFDQPAIVYCAWFVAP